LVFFTIDTERDLGVEEFVAIDVLHFQLGEVFAQIMTNLQFVTLTHFFDQWEYIWAVHNVQNLNFVDLKLNYRNIFVAIGLVAQWVYKFGIYADE